MPVHAGARGRDSYHQEGVYSGNLYNQYGPPRNIPSNYPAKDYGPVNGHDRLGPSYNGSPGQPGPYGMSQTPHRPSNGAINHTEHYGRPTGNQHSRHSSYNPPAPNGPQFDSGMGSPRNERPVSNGHKYGSGGKKSTGEINTDYFSHSPQSTRSQNSLNQPAGPADKSYPIMHLTTLTMDRKEGIANMEDAMRKLKLLDAKGKIWAQEISLKIYEKDIILVDTFTQDAIETLPLADLSMVSAEMNQSPYGNLMLLVFQFSNKKPPEIFFFSCESIPATEIVQQVKRAAEYATGRKKKTKKSPSSSGRGTSSDNGMMVPPPPQEPAPLPPDSHVKDKVAAFAAVAAAAQAGGVPQLSPSSNHPRPERGDSIEVLAMRTERDVELLNKCFDEIEYFIQRLQKAAEAYVELNNKRKSRRHKNREPGDGLLLTRSKPPSDAEYIHCYQMFKYCINLLAKLKNHIHDPNAPELVHFLFVPLKLVVEGSQGPAMARGVESPLLSPQAVDLLTNCLTSREADLWHSLGPAWNVPSTEWPKDKPVARYVPHFRDGWAPPPVPVEQVTPDINQKLAVSAGVAAQAAEAAARHEARRNVDWNDGPDGNFSQESRRSSNLSDVRPPSSPRHNEPPPQVRPKPQPPVATTPVHHATGQMRATYDFVARNSKELTIMAGEILDVLDNKRKWWEVRNSSGQTGYVPSTILESIHPSLGSGGPNPNSNHSNSSADNQIHPSPPFNDASNNSRGEVISQAEIHPPPSQFAPTPPPPPPPPPPPAPPAPNLAPNNNKLNIPKKNHSPHAGFGSSDFQSELTNTVRRKQAQRQQQGVNGIFQADMQQTKPTNNRSSTNMDALNEELLRRVNGGGPKRNYKVVKRSGPQVPLTNDSSPAEVTEWLNSKGFSKLTVTSLGVLSGAQLFSLTREELQQVCHADGARVYSQLMVQKSNLQALEANSTSAELNAIMERRKVRSVADDSLGLPPDFDPALPQGGR